MMRTRMMIGVITLCLIANRVASAQIVERTDSGAIQFTDAIVGKWEIDKVVASGSDASRNYGPSTFTKDSWTIQTRNGDHVYKLSSVNDSSDPLEATFDDAEGKNLSFTAFIHLNNDKLSIIRGIGRKNPIPLPKRMEEGASTLAYVFKRVADDKSSIAEVRVPLQVRLIEDTNDSKVLVDVKLKPFFGGKLVYHTEPRSNSAKQVNSPSVGTVINGEIEPIGDGNWSVLLIIEIGNQEHSDNAATTIVRSEKLQVNTVLRVENTLRIKCGENRTCELTLK